MAGTKWIFLLVALVLRLADGFGQSPGLNGAWRATLTRADSVQVVFNIEALPVNGKTVFTIINGKEKILIKSVTRKRDSVFFEMPAFESSFRAKILPNKDLRGTWTKGTSRQTQYWPFYATFGQTHRFTADEGPSQFNITGRWAVTFRHDTIAEPAVAEFEQRGSRLTGTFLTISGDFRYLDGIVTGNVLKLSVFDGSHAYLFTGRIDDSAHISSGKYYGGWSATQDWTALRDKDAQVPDVNTPSLKSGKEKLHFSFPDIAGKMTSIDDEQFRNKVTVVQIMGSWCPNCLDETKFLSEYYSKNRQRGIEMIALAYENSTDFARSQRSLRKFQQLFHVQYPMLISGVIITDSLRTEKTIPEITPIKTFPTAIFIGKDGKVKKISTDFFGPATGRHYEDFKRDFESTIERLLKE